MPLWLPFLILAIPTGLLWYWDRRSVRETIERLEDWVRPKWRRKITFWLVAACSVIHAVVVVVGVMTFGLMYDFFFPVLTPSARRAIGALEVWGVPCLLWATPLWGIGWAWLLVRLRNWLLFRWPSHYCFDCGYDLTGNLSGRCPECGKEIGDPRLSRNSRSRQRGTTDTPQEIGECPHDH